MTVQPSNEFDQPNEQVQTCVTAAVDAYLISLTVPRAGLRCPAR